MFSRGFLRESVTWTVLVGLMLLVSAPLTAQTVDECSTPDLIVSGSSTDSDTFEVIEDDTIIELNIRMSLSTTFAGYVDLVSVESPYGTIVNVHDSGGGGGDDFNLTYSDTGRGNSATIPAPPFPSTQSAYDCGGCLWQPYPGTLSAFDEESTAGDWTLEVTTTFASATIDSWCVVNFDRQPVSDVSCVEGDLEGEWSISWTNGDDYDSIEVRSNGDVIATEEVDISFGDTVTVESATGLPVPQTARFDIVPIYDGGDGPKTQCYITLLADPVASVSTGPGYDDSFGPTGILVDLLTFDEDVLIDDIAIRIDADGAISPGMVVMVESPDGTQVNLHNFFFGGPSLEENIDVNYWQTGIANGGAGSTPDGFDCDGCAMRPTGSLASFVGEETINDEGIGTWTLVMIPPNIGAEWTLNEWGIEIFDVLPTANPNITSCVVGTVVDTASITFTPGSDYSEVNFFVNDELIENREGPFTQGFTYGFVSDSYPIPSDLRIGVQGIADSGAPSEIVECGVAIRLPSVNSLACISTEYGVVDLTWTNGTPDYAGVDVYMDDEFVETLAGDATSVSYTSYPGGDPFEVPSTVSFSLVGYEDDGEVIAAPPARCTAVLLVDADITECAIGDEDTITLDIDIPDFLTVSDVEAITDVTSGFFSGMDMDIQSPDGTFVRTHDFGGPGDQPGFRSVVIWDDDGIVYNSNGDFTCACQMQPQLGAMANFAGDSSDGEWTCTITNTAGAFEPSWINLWCLRIYGCELLGPTDLVCEATDDNEATLTWTNPDEYLTSDGIEIYQLDGGDLVLQGTADGDATTFVVEDLGVGYHSFLVRGIHPLDDCSVDSESCRTAIGMYEQCGGGGFDFDGNLDETIIFVEPIQIADVSIVFDYAGTFSPGNLELESPTGTIIGLMGGSTSLAASGNRINVIFNDAGTPFSIPANDGSLRAPVSGSLSDFNEEIADGDWTLTSTINAAFVPGRIDDWCVAIVEGCTAPPPAELECTWEEGVSVDLTWLNFGEYENIRVYRNGDLVDTIAGDAVEYTDVPGEAGLYTYRIVGYDAVADCTSGSRTCETGVGLEIVCDSAPDPSDISSTLDPLEAIMTINDITVEDVQCHVEITHAWINELTVTLENPGGDEVTLHDSLGNANQNIDVIFSDSDDAIANVGGADFGCRCLMKPASGEMVDLAGDAIGDWTLQVEDAGTFVTTGSLEAWCLYLTYECPIEAPADLAAVSTDGQYPVELTWTNSALEDYDEINVVRSGQLVAELDGDVETYTDVTGPGGVHEYQVVAVSLENDCVKISQGTLIAVGRAAVCESPTFAIGGVNPDTGLEFLDWQMEQIVDCDAATGDATIADLEVQLSFTCTFVSDVSWFVASPSGTTVTLWNNNGGFVGWNSSDAVVLNDHGEPIPTTVPVDCNIDDCIYQPGGPIPFADFIGEDAVGEWILVGTSSNLVTLNEWCVNVFPEEKISCGQPFLRGDVDGSGNVNPIIDTLSLLEWFAADGDEPPCLKAADVDGNGAVNAIIDSLRLLRNAFGDADDPPAPYPDCGADVDVLSLDVSCDLPPDCS